VLPDHQSRARNALGAVATAARVQRFWAPHRNGGGTGHGRLRANLPSNTAARSRGSLQHSGSPPL